MKYFIKQKMFSIGDKFYIKDEQETDQFFVRGKVFSIGNKLSIEDMDGNVLLNIRQKVLRLLAEYHFFVDDQHIATVKRRFSFRPRFDIDSDYGNYEISGNLLAHKFVINRDDQVVATISKKYISWGDTYSVDIEDGENIPFILALVIVIDQVLHKNKGNSSSHGGE